MACAGAEHWLPLPTLADPFIDTEVDRYIGRCGSAPGVMQRGCWGGAIGRSWNLVLDGEARGPTMRGPTPTTINNVVLDYQVK